MRRFALLAAGTVLMGWGVFGVLGGCNGDDDASATETPDGAAGDETSSGASSGASGSSGTSGAPGGDASSTSSSGGTTPVSNPGKLTCGAVECDGGIGPRGASVCCVREAGASLACTREQDCNAGDLQIQCDEPADCFGGGATRCCLRGGRDPRTECRRACGENGVQLCKTSADCGDAGACSLKKCGNYDLHVCGSPEGCQ